MIGKSESSPVPPTPDCGNLPDFSAHINPFRPLSVYDVVGLQNDIFFRVHVLRETFYTDLDGVEFLPSVLSTAPGSGMEPYSALRVILILRLAFGRRPPTLDNISTSVRSIVRPEDRFPGS